MIPRHRITTAMLCCAFPTLGAQTADARFTAGVDSIARAVLASTGVPSASVAVVQHGRVVYANAYGTANLDAHTPAAADMRYAIGSISKQFTASAVLLLQQDGRLRRTSGWDSDPFARRPMRARVGCSAPACSP